MKIFTSTAAVLALAVSGLVYADDDCRSPMSEWQPREAVTPMFEWESREGVTRYVTELGITAERLRVDDGCYEVRGLDADGNRVELEIEPALLVVQKLKVRFQPDADLSRYLPAGQTKLGKAGENRLNEPGSKDR